MENYIFSPVNFASHDQTLKSTTKKVQTSKHYEQKSIEHGYMVLFTFYSLYHKKSAISFLNFIIDSIVSRGTSIVIVTEITVFGFFFTIHVFFACILLAMTAVIVCFSPQELM